MLFRVFVFSLALLVPLLSKAECSPEKAPRTILEKVGSPCVDHAIDPKHFNKFWDNWPLLTVRWREDTRELRVMYANDSARASLAKNEQFTPGAVFTKFAFKAEEDALFPNSLIPASDALRVQVMLRDPGHPDAIDGWRYALYTGPNPSGRLTKQEVAACAACHKLADSRQQIFSVPMLRPKQSFPSEYFSAANANQMFQPASWADVAMHLKELIPSEAQQQTSLRVVDMPLFEGSLNESRPVLLKQALEHKTTALMFDSNSPLFWAVAWPDPDKAGCAWFSRSLSSTGANPGQPGPVISSCQ